MICESVFHDPASPGRSYSLKSLLNWLRPEDEFGYPLVVERLDLFVQVWGERGQHGLTMELVLIENDEAGVERIVYAEALMLTVSGNEFIETKYWKLHQVVFPVAGLYEIRLRFDDGSLFASERLSLKEIE